MNDYKIKLIRNILNDFYKDKKRYKKNHKIRHAVIKYKKSKKWGKGNLFDTKFINMLLSKGQIIVNINLIGYLYLINLCKYLYLYKDFFK